MQTLPNSYLETLQKGRRTGEADVAHYSVRDPYEASDLAQAIAAGYGGSSRIRLGLCELLMNAIEHGNLEIGFDLKTILLDQGSYMDTLEFRLASQLYAGRHVDLFVETLPQKARFTVVDQGKGFDPTPFLANADEPSVLPHGRGIILASRTCFDQMLYNQLGNVVVGISNLTEGCPVRIN